MYLSPFSYVQNFTISDFASFARSMSKCFALLVLGQKARVRSPRGLRGTTAEAYNWNNDTFSGKAAALLRRLTMTPITRGEDVLVQR